MTLVGTEIKDFITIDQNYIKDISTENTILKIIANGFLMSEDVPQKLKNEIIENVGKRWFINIENDKVCWKDQ